jgi:hypothetical protein
MDITDEILEYKGIRYGRRFQIGDIPQNVLLSFDDKDENPYIQFGEYCSAEQIVAILNYTNQMIPAFTEVRFQDTSNFQVANKRTYIHVWAFSIAFNGKTWYEHHLNARRSNHTAYRNAVERMLFSEEYKAMTTFRDFLCHSAFAFEVMDELEPHYDAATTFNTFFQSLPVGERIRLTADWIHEFMKYHLGNDIYTDWTVSIPIALPDDTYYCPTTEIRHTPIYHCMDCDPADI